MIKKVVFKKHWSFRRQNDFVKEKAPFFYGCTIWGWFESPIEIYFKNWVRKQPIRLNHNIRIEGTGKHIVIPITINKNNIPQNFFRVNNQNPNLNENENGIRNGNGNGNSRQNYECRIF